MEIKHPRAIATALLLAGWATMQLTDKKPDGSAGARTVEGSVATDKSKLGDFSLPKVPTDKSHTENFLDSATIEKYYPNLSENYKKHLLAMLAACSEKAPALMDKLEAALKAGISPALFDDFWEEGDYLTSAENLIETYESLVKNSTEQHDAFGSLQNCIESNRLVREASLFKFNNLLAIQEHLENGTISKDELFRALNSEDSSKVQEILLRPFTEMVRATAPEFNLEQAQAIARYLSNGRWLAEPPPKDKDNFSQFLKDYLSDPQNSSWLSENLATIRTIEERASRIEDLDLHLLSAVNIDAASKILGALESNTITPSHVEELVQLRGKHGLSMNESDILQYLSDALSVPGSSNQIQEFLAQVKSNQDRMSLIGGDSHDLLSSINPSLASEVLDRLPNLSPKDNKEASKVFVEVKRVLEQLK